MIRYSGNNRGRRLLVFSLLLSACSPPAPAGENRTPMIDPWNFIIGADVSSISVPEAKALSGLIPNAILDARREVPDHISQAYRQAVSAALKRSLDSLSFDVVQNGLKRQKASAEIVTESLLVGEMRASLDPVVENTGGLSSDLAHALPSARLTLLEVIPLKDTLAETIGAYLSAHTKEKKDIWADRDVTLDPGKNYRPVNVAVWDSGVDLSIFKDRSVKNGAGQPAVLAYDLYSRKTTGDLYPLNREQSREYGGAKKQLKGLMDMQANLDTPEAAELRQTLAKLKPEEVRPFIEKISFYSNYAHGTHVAGILMEGNPYARLVTGRLTFDWKMIPDPCPSRELMDRGAAASHLLPGLGCKKRTPILGSETQRFRR